MESKKDEKNFYVSNKEFYEEMVEYKKALAEAEEKGEPVPQIPDCIARKIILIAERLSYRPNFIRYTYRDEMVADAIKNCIRYLHNFDPDKSKNPFSYFTQFCFYAFVRRIKKEKQQFNTKAKLVQQSSVHVLGSEMATQDHDDGSYDNSYRDYIRDMYEVDLQEEKKEPTTRTTKSTSVDLTDFVDKD